MGSPTGLGSVSRRLLQAGLSREGGQDGCVTADQVSGASGLSLCFLRFC